MYGGPPPLVSSGSRLLRERRPLIFSATTVDCGSTDLQRLGEAPSMNTGACVGWLLLLAAAAEARVTGSTYDQRQEGDVNVQIDVKDLQIVALLDSEMLDDYTNYDYAYDYADFTIKPISRPTTTSRPPSTAADSPSSSTPLGPNSTTAVDDEQQSSVNPSSSQAAEAAATTPGSIVPSSTGGGIGNATEGERKRLVQSEDAPTTVSANSSAANATKVDPTQRPQGVAEPRKKCPVGFLLKSGRCFKRRLSFISPRRAIMKLAPTLLSKTKVLAGKLAGNS